MRVPFTQQQFLDVFGAYNATAWPAVVVLWLVTLAFGIRLVRGRTPSTTLSALAAVHWAWSGLVYHALFFTDINPAAWLFAGVFLLEAFAFVWFGIVRRTLAFRWGHTTRHAMAAALFVYSLGYPFLVLASGHAVPRAPLYAVPCPTTLFTAALLLTAVRPAPVIVFVIPVMWAAIAGTAALTLGVTPDLMLFVAAVCLVVYVGLPFATASAATAHAPSIGDVSARSTPRIHRRPVRTRTGVRR
jgi:hypothetical protein